MKNKATEKIMADCQVILDQEIPRSMHETIKRLIEIVSVLQGEIEGLSDSVVDLEVRLRRLERGGLR